MRDIAIFLAFFIPSPATQVHDVNEFLFPVHKISPWSKMNLTCDVVTRSSKEAPVPAICPSLVELLPSSRLMSPCLLSSYPGWNRWYLKLTAPSYEVCWHSSEYAAGTAALASSAMSGWDAESSWIWRLLVPPLTSCQQSWASTLCFWSVHPLTWTKSVQFLVHLITYFCEAAGGSRLETAQEWEMLHCVFIPICFYFFLCYASIIHFLSEELPNWCLCRPFKVVKLKLVCKYQKLLLYQFMTKICSFDQMVVLIFMNGILSALFWKALKKPYISRCYGAILSLW